MRTCYCRKSTLVFAVEPYRTDSALYAIGLGSLIEQLFVFRIIAV